MQLWSFRCQTSRRPDPRIALPLPSDACLAPARKLADGFTLQQADLVSEMIGCESGSGTRILRFWSMRRAKNPDPVIANSDTRVGCCGAANARAMRFAERPENLTALMVNVFVDVVCIAGRSITEHA
jgi:hypothetical protein